MRKNSRHDLLALLSILGILLFLKIPFLNLILALIAVLIYTSRKGGIVDELGFHRPKSWTMVLLLSVCLSIVVFLISYFALLPIIERLTGTKLDVGMFESIRDNHLMLVSSLGLGWVVGGLVEEIVFRSFIIRGFAKIATDKIGVILGVLVSASLFGYLHTYQGITGQILTGFVGLILAIIFVINKRSIWLNVFTHGFINTISMIMLYFEVI